MRRYWFRFTMITGREAVAFTENMAEWHEVLDRQGGGSENPEWTPWLVPRRESESSHQQAETERAHLVRFQWAHVASVETWTR